MKKKFLSAACIALSLMMFAGCDNAESAENQSSGTTTASVTEEVGEKVLENQVEAEQLLVDLNGTYGQLWDVVLADEYKQFWLDNCAKLVGEENAEGAFEMLSYMVTGTLTGEEAAEAYKDSGMAYCCEFLQNVSEFTFDGTEISGVDSNGNELFKHTYHYIGMEDVRGLYIYESDDDDSGEFTYFFIAPDTMDTTWHIEFRYGIDKEALMSYDSGKYAYWLASGISVDYTQSDAENAIKLFCTENLSGTADTAEEIEFDGGSGTEESPYEIASLETFKAFADSVNDGSQGGYMGKFIKLTADIDLDGTEFQPIGNMNDTETMSTMFSGSFDGDNHTISNFTYETDKQSVGIGIFGMNCGEIKNLNAVNSVVTVTDLTSQAIGGVVGYNMGGTVENVSLSGKSKITGNCCVGGIIGGNMGAVKDCTADGVEVVVIGDNEFGDRIVQCDIAECGGLIIGGGFGGTIDGCKAVGKITSGGNEPVGIGGIGGCLEMMDSITNCEADVIIELSGGGHAIGGLCGYAGTHSDPDIVLETEGISTKNYPYIIDNCNIKININANGVTHVGGLVGIGLYYYGEETRFKITNCTVSGSINGAVTPGTIAGRAEGCEFENNAADVEIDGNKSEEEIGSTDKMYESADQ